MAKVKKTSSRALPELPKRTKKNVQCPATLYLDSLEDSGRRAMGILLEKVASMFGYESIESLPWENLRYDTWQKSKANYARLKTNAD